MSVIGIVRAFRTLGSRFERMLAAQFPTQRDLYPLARDEQLSAPNPEEPSSLRGPGRPQGPGRWDLLALAYVASRDRSVESFCHRWSGSGLFHECGFGDWEPDPRTVRLHFVAMEDQQWQAFGRVANALIAHAHSRDDRIGSVTFGDATKWQSPARLKRLHPESGGTKWSTKNVLSRASDDDAQNLHEKEGETPEPEETVWEDERGEVVAVEGAVEPYRTGPGRQYFEINGVEYVALDQTSGLRKVVKQPGNRVDVWFGGYAFSLVDGFTGLRLSTQTFRADEQEYDHLPAAVDEITATIGAPSVISVDRFSSIRDAYEYCTRRGIYLVAPYKGTVQKPERQHMRTDAFDEHQIPRCPHCGGESDITSPGLGHYFAPNGEPRIRARCINRDSEECRRQATFSIACETEWRMLTGLPLTTQLWHAVSERHQTFEAVFNNDRDRHGFAGKDTTGMLSRRGVPAQRLRGEIARLLDWFRACLRNGWIEGWERTNAKEPVDLMQPHRDRRKRLKPGLGSGRLARVLAARRKRALNLPYGSVAERLGLVPAPANADGPSEQPPQGGQPPPDAAAPADRG